MLNITMNHSLSNVNGVDMYLPNACSGLKRSRNLFASEDTSTTSNKRQVSQLYLSVSPAAQPASRSTTHAAASSQGGRPYQEDTYYIGQLDDEKKANFFGVYDGHGSDVVSQYLAEKAHTYVTESLASRKGETQVIEEAIIEAFRRLDADVPSNGGKEVGGSTANVLLLFEDTIVCANCGDSRAVLARNGKAVELSSDHKPDREDEEARIKAAGGRVLHNSGARVMGVLGMSRAIGDTWLQKYGVIPDPEVKVLQRSPDDEFIILASDGLWGAVSNEEAVKIARRCIQRAESKKISRAAATRVAAKVLLRAAVHCGSRDNITVLIVDLKLPQDEIEFARADGLNLDVSRIQEEGKNPSMDDEDLKKSPEAISAIQKQRMHVQHLLLRQQQLQENLPDSVAETVSMSQLCTRMRVPSHPLPLISSNNTVAALAKAFTNPTMMNFLQRPQLLCKQAVRSEQQGRLLSAENLYVSVKFSPSH